MLESFRTFSTPLLPAAAQSVTAFGLLVGLLLCAGCDDPPGDLVQGYVEGEFVHVAPPQGGQLESLHVARGDQVESGELLFVLKSTPEKAARDQAVSQLAQARSFLEDAMKGLRPTEIQAIEAELKEARTALSLAESVLARIERLRQTGSVTDEQLDRARSEYTQRSQQVIQQSARLETARLGNRDDQIAAAKAEVEAREAALTRAEWDLSQMSQSAPQSGVVFDTLFREGEWVAAGRPVVSLLPPEFVKVRAFVPQTRLATLRIGDDAQVFVDGLAEPLTGTIVFVSPRAEFTPPVIFSRESRTKLVFLVELRFEPEVAATLHPGQPVDVKFAR